jgi:hypothetical protein
MYLIMQQVFIEFNAGYGKIIAREHEFHLMKAARSLPSNKSWALKDKAYKTIAVFKARNTLSLIQRALKEIEKHLGEEAASKI